PRVFTLVPVVGKVIRRAIGVLASCLPVDIALPLGAKAQPVPVLRIIWEQEDGSGARSRPGEFGGGREALLGGRLRVDGFLARLVRDSLMLEGGLVVRVQHPREGTV